MNSRESRSDVRIGIDATNIRMGGGLTHLVETLNHADPRDAGVGKVIVWAPSSSLDRMPVRDWLELRREPWLDGSLPYRAAWQTFKLTSAIRRAADVLYVPGGSYSGSFRPFVTIAQSMLPFDDAARRRYPITSWMRLRNTIVRATQERTMRRADGMIFLTDYDRHEIERQIGRVRGQVAIIPYGVTPGIVSKTSTQAGTPFRWIYMSTIDMYKHHDVLTRAAITLARAGHSLSLDFVGPAYEPALRHLRQVMNECDPGGQVVRYLGLVAPSRVKTIFAEYDASVFASSCESFGIPLLDAMQAGLPTACSSLSTMPEIAGNAVEYFDPRDVTSTAEAMRKIMTGDELRARLAGRGRELARRFDWTSGATAQMRFMARIARERPETASRASVA